MTASIVIDHLTKHFGSVKAVVDVTLEVAAAEIVVRRSEQDHVSLLFDKAQGRELGDDFAVERRLEVEATEPPHVLPSSTTSRAGSTLGVGTRQSRCCRRAQYERRWRERNDQEVMA